MRLGAMQPYFFPYLGYYDLINRTDRWVVFDVVKYKPKTWMNRNRILHPTGGWQYITVPVDKHGENGLIQNVRLIDPDAARRRILGQIEHYRKAWAPYYSAVRELTDACFAGSTGKLTDLNVRALRLVCEYLNIRFDAVILSESGIELPEINHPGDWALEISSALGATGYVNPPNGRELFDPDKFARRGIGLSFTEVMDFRYPCGPYTFVERLSILDVLMWNSPASIKNYLDEAANKTVSWSAP